MKGIGKRVTIGFFSIVILLSISGVISLFELSNLSYDTEAILKAGGKDMEVAKHLLRSANDHSRAVMDIAIFGDESKVSKRDEAIISIGEQLEAIRNRANNELSNCIDSLAFYASKMDSISRSTIILADTAQLDSVFVFVAPIASEREWYESVYEPECDHFIEQTKRYMSLSHGQLGPSAEQLSKNAYRSVTPVLISLLVMIAVVLMLYYFVYAYGVKPILRMNKALSDYISFKMPFAVKSELIDELKELHDNIDTLVTSSKSNK